MNQEIEPADRTGLAAALAAYVSWGLMPIYFKLLEPVSAWEIIAHRVIWAIPILLLFLLMRDGRALWEKAAREPPTTGVADGQRLPDWR